MAKESDSWEDLGKDIGKRIENRFKKELKENTNGKNINEGKENKNNKNNKTNKNNLNNKFGRAYSWSCGMGGFSMFGLVFGMLIVAWGIIEIGNNLGYWKLTLPLFPAIAVAFGLSIVLSEIRKMIER